MRYAAIVLAGMTFLAAILLLPILVYAFHQYPYAQLLIGLAIGLVLLGCLLIVVMALTRRYEWNIALPPCIGVIGLVSIIGLDVPLMVLNFALLLSAAGSGLAMNRQWREEARAAGT